MRRVILQEFVSVDGLAAGPGGDVGFVPAANQGDRSFGDRQMDFIDSVDTMLLGRVTYEMFAQHWPRATSGEDAAYAGKLNALGKVVFSKTLDRAPWGDFDDARIVSSDAADEVRKLKEQPGKDMVVWGSLSLAQALTRAGVVDETQLIVCPVVLGSGRSLFGDGVVDHADLELTATRSFDRGSVLLAYRRK